jgi:predicted secreted Zn-dependent protease
MIRRKKMTMQKTTKKEEEKTTVADRLPELTEENLAGAATNAAWAAWYGGAEQGRVFHEDLGISLQAVSNRTVRCLSVGDHPACYLALACMAHSFELVGVEFQLDPYTIPRPAPPEEPEKPPTTEPGLEVA